MARLTQLLDLLVSPTRFFEESSDEDALYKPILGVLQYILLFYIISTPFILIYYGFEYGWVFAPFAWLLGIVGTAGDALARTLFKGGIVHIAAKTFGAVEDFTETYRAVGYGSVVFLPYMTLLGAVFSAILLLPDSDIVAIVGLALIVILALAGLVHSFITTVIGLNTTQGLETLHSVMSLVIYYIAVTLFIFLIAGFIFMFFFAIIASLFSTAAL